MHDLIRPDASFTPRELFARMQGAWFEPRQGYMWQENTGVTPTTSGGQTIGKIIDLSAGRVASQATAANRPLFGARRNLLVYSEQFDANVTTYSRWERYNLANVVANSELSPIGTMTADKLVENTATGVHGVVFFFANAVLVSGATYTFSVYAKAAERSILYLGENSGGDFVGAVFAYFDLATGSIGTKGAESIPSITATNDGWYRCSITVTRTTSAIDIGLLCLTALSDGVVSYAGSSNSGLHLWGGHFVAGATATDYQRVTTATDYDAGQFPAIRHADSTDVLVAAMPDLDGGVFSSAGSVYFATPQGMSCLHNQSIGTSYNLPAQQTDVYGIVITPARLVPPLEQRLALYMHRLAGLSDADFFWQEQATDGMTGQLLADDNDIILLRA